MTDTMVDAFILRVLGPTELLGRGGEPVEGIVRQPKQLALLTYLALTTANGFRRRDQVISFFWPDFDQTQARTRLRKALHGLREELGGDAVVTRGEEEVRVEPARVWCDAVALGQELAAGRWRETLALYRGPLLEGLFVEGVAQEFEEWLDEQRARLKRQAAQAAWEVSKEEEARGDRKAAAALARRALELTPDDEEGIRRLMILLDAQGDRGGALRVYTEWQARMQAVYGVEPAPETRKVARRVQAARKGESHETPPALGTQPVAAAAATGSAALATPAPRRRSRAMLTGVAAGVAFVILMAVTLWNRGTPSVDPSSIAVLPLRDIGGGTGEGERVTEELTSALTQIPGLIVRSASRARDAVSAGGDVDRIGRRLGVAWVVDGGVQRGPQRIRFTMRLVRTADAVSVWAGTYDGDVADPITAAQHTAAEAAAQIGSRLKVSRQ